MRSYVVGSIVIMLATVTVAVFAIIAEIVPTFFAIVMTTALAVLALGQYPWRMLRISEIIATKDIHASRARHDPLSKNAVLYTLPVRLIGAGNTQDSYDTTTLMSTPEDRIGRVPVERLRPLIGCNSYLVVTEEGFELWKHAPLRFAKVVSFHLLELLAASSWDHDPDGLEGRYDFTIELMFANKTPLWLRTRVQHLRTDPGFVVNYLERRIRRRF